MVCKALPQPSWDDFSAEGAADTGSASFRDAGTLVPLLGQLAKEVTHTL